jgi:hypothetical protein
MAIIYSRITGGNCHDMVGAKLLLSEQKGERIIAD